MSISFQCPSCGQFIKRSSQTVDGFVTCPGCQHKMKGPPASDPPAQPAAQKQTASSTSKPLQAGEFRVTCGHCAKSIRVPLKRVG